MKNTYDQNGYIVLRDVFFQSQVEDMRSECETLLASRFNHPQNIRSLYQKNSGRVPERFDPIVDISDIFREAAHDPALRTAMGTCLGEPPVLFKDKLILKPPGADGYPLHQDFSWWSSFCSDGQKMASAMIAIDDMNQETGCLEVFIPVPKTLIALNRDFTLAEEKALTRRHERHALVMKAGDVAIFSGLLPHRSGPNVSSMPRRAAFFTYNGASYGVQRRAYYDYYRVREQIEHPQKSFW